jgi:hypothetical protein
MSYVENGNSRSDSIVRVQALVHSDAVRLLKRFAESLRDAVRAGGQNPMLPTSSDIDSAETRQSNIQFVRVSVLVPRSSIHMVRAYSRILRDASRSGTALPKFLSGLARNEAAVEPMTTSKISPAISHSSIDTAQIRNAMRAAREVRNV